MARTYHAGDLISFAEAERLLAERRHEELAYCYIEGVDPIDDEDKSKQVPNKDRTNVSRMKAQKVRSAIDKGFKDLHS